MGSSRSSAVAVFVLVAACGGDGATEPRAAANPPPRPEIAASDAPRADVATEEEPSAPVEVPVMVQLSYSSYGDHGAPQQSADLEIDAEGHAVVRQTFGGAVGRFARALTTSERAELERALTSARGADAPAPADRTGPVSPSGATEQLIAAGLPPLSLERGETPPPGFGDLVQLLQTLREGVADSPLAAIELVVDGSPLGARLRHVGTEPIAVRGGAITVRTTSFRRDSAIADSVSHTVDASQLNGPVGSGWELRLADDLGISRAPRGGMLTVRVEGLAVDTDGNGAPSEIELGWMIE